MKKVYVVLRTYENHYLPVLNMTTVYEVYENAADACKTADNLNRNEIENRGAHMAMWNEEPTEEVRYYINVVDLIEEGDKSNETEEA